MTSKIYSATLIGLDAKIIEVEADFSSGLPGMFIVGLAGTSIKESRERVRACLRNSKNFKYPVGRISINLAPADLYKYGTQFDAAIAMGILASSDQLPFDSAVLDTMLFLGELALDGKVRGIRGALAMVMEAKQKSFQKVFVPEINMFEASLVSGIECISVLALQDAVDYCCGIPVPERPVFSFPTIERDAGADFSEIAGQHFAKRGLEIAAAGGHNISFVGPPGAGKTILANSLVSILPNPEHGQILEQVKIYSAAGFLDEGKVMAAPFRNPHHTITQQAFIGGGTVPKPGEISLAHNGVLFLDEFPEFQRPLIETLRQPLEAGYIKVFRLQGNCIFPANFILVTAQNPCPCGYAGDQKRVCVCTPGQLQKYKTKISGPILDRIDLRVFVERLNIKSLQAAVQEETSAKIRARVEAARQMQYQRYGRLVLNGRAEAQEIVRAHAPTAESKKLLEAADAKYNLSPRAYYRILKIARTIADLAGCAKAEAEHVAEALQYKLLE